MPMASWGGILFVYRDIYIYGFGIAGAVAEDEGDGVLSRIARHCLVKAASVCVDTKRAEQGRTHYGLSNIIHIAQLEGDLLAVGDGKSDILEFIHISAFANKIIGLIKLIL